MTNKAFTVLRYLVEHPTQLVPQEALTEAHAALDDLGPHYCKTETYLLRGEWLLMQEAKTLLEELA